LIKATTTKTAHRSIYNNASGEIRKLDWDDGLTLLSTRWPSTEGNCDWIGTQL
jgi:hypothetical protein